MITTNNSYTSHNKHFILQILHFIGNKILLLNTLHCISLSCWLVHTCIHHRISSRTEGFFHFLWIRKSREWYITITETMLDCTTWFLFRGHDIRRRRMSTILRGLRGAILNNSGLLSNNDRLIEGLLASIFSTIINRKTKIIEKMIKILSHETWTFHRITNTFWHFAHLFTGTQKIFTTHNVLFIMYQQ